MTKNTDSRGRPELPEKNRRSEVVQFRCTASEKKKLEQMARTNGTKLSDWLRQQILAQA